MTIQTRSTLKSVFEQGDTPQGSDFEDLIDSFLSLADTTAQTVQSPVNFEGQVQFNSQVSIARVVTNTIEAVRIDVNQISAAAVTAQSGAFFTLTTDGLVAASIQASDVSAAAATIANFVAVTAKVSGLAILDTLNLQVATTATAQDGGGQTLPAQVAGWIEVSIGASPRRIPFFAV